MNVVFFDNWDSIIRTFVITILAYVLLIFLLRVFGKRTLSKMNAFDFIVTVALGSTLATVMLNKDIALVDGVLGFFLLIFLQFLITWLSARYKAFSSLIKSTPTLLLYKGEMLKKIMLKERIDEDEIHAIVREKGYPSIEGIDAIVLETDGSLTVIKDTNSQKNSSMQKVKNWSHEN
ncbi:MAG: DUF421 domain-containing protein [Flavisolibacter sp.]|jgi:uncharacterized membrane protein YcaP (DUF421 family)|nr:DUF421 domain-containing protein [Flavisolibacter sp.]